MVQGLLKGVAGLGLELAVPLPFYKQGTP